MSNKNMYNMYKVNFKNNPPITIWAKGCEVRASNGVQIIEFVDLDDSTKITYVNSREVLFIETIRSGVTLEKI